MLRWNKLTLNSKLLLTFSTVLMVIIALICIIIYHKNVNEMKKQTHFLSSVLSKQFNKTLELYIEDVERVSLSIFTDPVIQNVLTNYKQLKNANDIFRLKNEIYPHLFNRSYSNPNIESVSVYTMEGFEYKYTRRGGITAGYNGLESWMEDLNNIPKTDFLLLPTEYLEMDRGSSEFIIPFVRNIYQIPQRYKIGTMKIHINTKVLKDLFQFNDNHELDKYIRVFIMSDDGAVIYDNEDQLTGRTQIGFETSIFSNATNTGNVDWRGKNYLYSFDQSNYADWNTTVLISNKFIVAEQQKILKYILIIGLLSMLIIVVLSYFLSHHITKPIRKMIEMMKRTKQGKLHERIDPSTGTVETDLLSNVYNNMLDSINQLIKEVYESRLVENDAKLLALQSQINPHFLYNTLNVMKSISRIKGVEEVVEISESLADLFKYSMKQLKEPVPLQEEVIHIQNYMKIQHHRFGDRFQLICEIPNHLIKANIPKLTIQPLVENAVKHGFSQTKKECMIELKVREKNDVLFVHVKDNGKGMDPTHLKRIRNKLARANFIRNDHHEQDGIGLINIQQRIQLLYGHKYCLHINSEESVGTEIVLEIPFSIQNHVKDVRVE